MNYSLFQRYGVAVLAVAIALLLKLLLAPLTGMQPPFVLFFIAVVLSAWYGGRCPGVLAIGLSAIVSDYFFLSPSQPLLQNQPTEILELGSFVFESGVVTLLFTALHSAKQRAETSTQNAESHYQRLLDSEERFRLLIEGMKEYAIFMLDQSGHFTSWNVGAERILGYQESEIIGQSFDCIYTSSDLEIGRPAFALQHAIAEGQTQDERWHVRKDGSLFWADGVIAPLHDEAGNIRGFFKILRDMTGQKQAEEERAQLLVREQTARAEAEAANRSKDEFLSIVSHELRTPLSAILLWTELLRAGDLDEATIAQALEIVERNAKSQSKLIDDLLDISRIITGNLRLNVQLVELVPVIQAAIDSMRLAAQTKRINLQTQLNSGIGLVLGDPQRLQQIVTNLLSNAIKFTPNDGTVEICLHRRGVNAEIIVADTGCGISAEFLPFVFDHFRQANSTPTRTQGGLGLGLAIVRQLVELHHGTVEVKSLGEGIGTTFTILLPLAAFYSGASSEASIDCQAEDDFDQFPQLAEITVLVVDDEIDMRQVIAIVLGRYGAEVIAVASAGEALTVFTETSRMPDVLVCDIGLPDEDGYAFIQKVRLLDAAQGGKIPAVALTAYVREEERRQAFLAGFQIHISKPFKPCELVTAVATLVGQSQNR